MEWLKDHGYLAGWIALPLAVVLFILQNVKTQFRNVDWSRTLIYIAFCISLGIAFTPTMDNTSRMFAKDIAECGFVFLIIDRPYRSSSS